MTGASDPLVLELTCTLDASPERIFQALTDPAELVKWWGPSGFTTPEIELDPRVGGSYRLGMQPPDGELFHLVVICDAPVLPRGRVISPPMPVNRSLTDLFPYGDRSTDRM